MPPLIDYDPWRQGRQVRPKGSPGWMSGVGGRVESGPGLEARLPFEEFTVEGLG